MKKTYIENVHLMMTQEFMTSIKKKKWSRETPTKMNAKLSDIIYRI